MAFQFLPALKALAPIVASASGLGSWFVNRNQDKTRGTELRISELETVVEEQGKTMAQLAEQVHLMAGVIEEKDRQILQFKRAAVAAWIALIVAVAAAVIAAIVWFR